MKHVELYPILSIQFNALGTSKILFFRKRSESIDYIVSSFFGQNVGGSWF